MAARERIRAALYADRGQGGPLCPPRCPPRLRGGPARLWDLYPFAQESLERGGPVRHTPRTIYRGFAMPTVTTGSNWGVRTRVDFRRGDAVKRKPIDVNEFRAAADKYLRALSTGEWQDPDNWGKSIMNVADGSFSKADVDKLRRWMGKIPSRDRKNYFDYNFGDLFARAYERASRASGKSTVPTAAVAKEATRIVEQTVRRFNSVRPRDLEKSEIKAIKAREGTVGWVVDRLYSDQLEVRASAASHSVEPDPAAKRLRTPDDFLRYNAEYYFGNAEDPAVFKSISLAKVPRELQRAVKAAARGIEVHGESDDFEVTEVYKKPGDRTVVGYVVSKSFSDASEDFSEQGVAAMNLKGKVVYSEVQDW